MATIFSFLIISFVICFILSIFLFLFLKKKNNTQSNNFNKELNSQNIDIIRYKIDMACERTSNHIITDSNISIYDKLDTGAQELEEYIKSNDYKISDICRRIQ